jgi:hypothetical protein
MQASLEAEVKGKNEAIRQKKKLEIDIVFVQILKLLPLIFHGML